MKLDLVPYGLTVKDVRHNLAPAKLYADAIRADDRCDISHTGALIAYSGDKTGRSPRDKRIVRHPDSEPDIWWGPVNIPIDHDTFQINLERAKDYFNIRPRLYVVDGYAGWDPAYRLKVRVISTRPYHALFMHNLLIRPTPEELRNFGEPEAVIYNAGQFPANQRTQGMTSKTSIDLCLESREMVILGTEYAGEMKKGVFTMMNYFMPKRGILSMHCSATADKASGRTSLMFGLSGTGKTTLSADPTRLLIGDDEHCWTDQGIFNIEGGCYAKALHLAPETEPEIYQALRFGAVLENVVYDHQTHHVDFHSSRITENTRGAYPIEYISNANIPCVGDHPSDVIFLTCDAFGVLPPVSRLNAAQAMYHYISGYTAKVAGTEVGVTEPQATFSPCFGGPFLMWRPAKYAELLAAKMRERQANDWLVNTGWSGGAFGTGQRMSLKVTRAIVSAIHSGELARVSTTTDPHFGVEVPTACPGVEQQVLLPRNTWTDQTAYDTTARRLIGLFRDNFKKYESDASPEVRAAGPA
jgi:phosphoenolpyruvate carboxykinase (ATP)